MAPPEFFFAIDFSDHRASREMFREVVARVLEQAGCGTDGLLEALQSAVENSSSGVAASCKLTFVARDGRLDIVLSSASGQIWQTTESLG